MIGFLIAMISGALMSIQGVFNTQLTKHAGIWTTASFVQFSALIVCLAAGSLTEKSSFMNIVHFQPRYMLLGGVLGAFITITVIKSMDLLGPAKAAMLIVISQLIIAYIIEVFGMFQVEKQALELRKVVGMVIAIVGIIVFKL